MTILIGLNFVVINKKHTLQNGWTEAIRNERIASKGYVIQKYRWSIWIRFGKRVNKLLDHIVIGFI